MYPPGGPRQPDVDFEHILGSLRTNFNRIFGRLGGGGLGGVIILGVALIAVVWAATGIYTISPGQGAALRLFGAVQGNPVTEEGLHWWWPGPVGKKNVVLTTETRTMRLGFRSGAEQGVGNVPVPEEALMITGDLNIVDVNLVVQYNIKNLPDFLFRVNDPGEDTRQVPPGQPDGLTLKDAAEAALRLVIGQSSIDDVITEQRALIESETQGRLQQILDSYGTGINIVNVELQDVKAPADVQDAFQDVLRARQERDTKENQARAYQNDIIPRARGEAERIRQQAEAFRKSRIATSEGEASQFLSVLAAYRESEEVTRYRLYLETIESVLPGTHKIIAPPGAQPLLILNGSNGTVLPLPPPPTTP